jgi:hypothetical protein
VNSRNAIKSLALQNQRLADMLRGIDSGLWWSTDTEARLDADRISAQAEIIRLAIDETERLVERITA